MDAKARRKLENELVVMGLKPVNDPELLQQLADLVSSWPGDKHEYMRDLINECEPAERYEMYHALAPRLKFKALSLEQYEAQIALKAGAMISQGRMKVEGRPREAIEIGGHRIPVVSKSQATGAVATVCCHRCGKKDQFIDDTPVAAMTAARRAGWIREPGVNKECCPECAAGQAAEVIQLAKGKTLAVYDRRAVKLDS